MAWFRCWAGSPIRVSNASIPAGIGRSFPSATKASSKVRARCGTRPSRSKAPQKSGNLTWGHADGPDKQHVRVLEQRVEFPITATADPSDTRAFIFLVAGDTAQSEANIAKFNGTLFWSFAILGLGLIAAIFIQVRVGLLPLRKVSESLARIRDGSARRLEGDFPAEIAPLAGELNSLIEHSAEVVGRARTHVSNLAHFLKTPLTILSSEASAQPGPARRSRAAAGRRDAPPGRSLSYARTRGRRGRCAGQSHAASSPRSPIWCAC